MVTNRRTRRSLLSGIAAASALGLAGCSGSETPATPTTGDAASGSSTGAALREGVSYPEPDAPVTEVTLLETRFDYEVVMAETKRDEKYLGATMRVPEARFFGQRGNYFAFIAYEDGDGRSPQEAFALRVDDVEQDSFPADESIFYTIEGPLDSIETLGGGDVLVLGGGTVEVTRNG